MRGDSSTMTVLRPVTAGEAVRSFAAHPQALPVAGGTDVMVAWNAGRLNGRTVLDLSAVREWKAVDAGPRGVRIGALVTHARIQSHPLLRRSFPLLVRACSTVGALQVQNRGTIGGNIANASPAGDTFPPLAVYGASVHTVSPRGGRSVPLLDFFSGVKKTTLEPSELIAFVELPLPAPRPSRGFFRKVGARAAQTISKTVGAGLLWLRKRGGRSVPEVVEARLAFGSVAPTVRRLAAVEAFLAGKALSREAAEEACRLVRRDISPIDDIRSTAAYRLRVTENIVRDFLSS